MSLSDEIYENSEADMWEFEMNEEERYWLYAKKVKEAVEELRGITNIGRMRFIFAGTAKGDYNSEYNKLLRAIQGEIERLEDNVQKIFGKRFI